MTDYTGTTIKLPQEVARSLDQQLTRQPKVYFLVLRNMSLWRGVC